MQYTQTLAQHFAIHRYTYTYVGRETKTPLPSVDEITACSCSAFRDYPSQDTARTSDDSLQAMSCHYHDVWLNLLMTS